MDGLSRLTRIDIYNYSDVEYVFGGEYFEYGGWRSDSGKERKIPAAKPCGPSGAGSSNKTSTTLPGGVVSGTSPSSGSSAAPQEKQKLSSKVEPGQCRISFSNKSWVAGVAGYVYYMGSDSSCIELAFSHPMIGPNCFTARRHSTFSGNAKVGVGGRGAVVVVLPSFFYSRLHLRTPRRCNQYDLI